MLCDSAHLGTLTISLDPHAKMASEPTMGKSSIVAQIEAEIQAWLPGLAKFEVMAGAWYVRGEDGSVRRCRDAHRLEMFEVG